MTTLDEAERNFYKTKPGSSEENAALQKWRYLCLTESAEMIPISAYLRRRRETRVAAKKAARYQNKKIKKTSRH